MLDIFDKIKLELGENFKTGDDTVLANIIDETITDALSISNRENTDKNIQLLSSDISKCAISKYLIRGSEGSKSISTQGTTASLENPIEVMRNDIVKSGKRVPFI